MKINDFCKLVAEKEQGEKEVDIAQIKEIVSIINNITEEKLGGVNLYNLINLIGNDDD